jgi:hypothetical protein
MEAQHAQSIWEAAIIPALSGFLLCVGVILFSVWKPAPRLPAWRPLDAARRRLLVRRSAALVAMGYGTFLLIVLVYSELLQHEPEGLPLAWWSGLFLLACAVPVWIALTWIVDRRAGVQQEKRAGRESNPQPSDP